MVRSVRGNRRKNGQSVAGEEKKKVGGPVGGMTTGGTGSY